MTAGRGDHRVLYWHSLLVKYYPLDVIDHQPTGMGNTASLGVISSPLWWSVSLLGNATSTTARIAINYRLWYYNVHMTFGSAISESLTFSLP